MAEFPGDLQNLKPSFSEMNSNMELIINSLSALETLNSGDNGLMALSTGSFSDHQQPQLPMNFTDNIQNFFHPDGSTAFPVVQSLPSTGDSPHESENGKVTSVTESLVSSSPPVSGADLGGDNKTRNNSLGGRKRKRSNEKEVEKPREVIHVRARRGQATDSHSLAERVRREKINERLRCLQDLVPGCYKTMGMSVMLDVIINYVQSLQNQIEFLSMKLSAASLYYDFNSSETDAMETMQGTNEYEVQEMARMLREGYGGLSSLQPTWPL